MTVELHTAAHIGERPEQQDAAGDAALNDGAGSHLLVLADGVGGKNGSAIASQIAADTFIDAADSGAFDDVSSQRDALSDALTEANRHIRAQGEANSRLKGMATTLVAAIVTKDKLRWLSVGDSHLYLIRGGKLRKLNEDHSVAHMLVKAGKYAPSDPALRKFQNALASAVAGGKIKHIDLPEQPVHLYSGDIVLLASDGLDTLPRTRIGSLVGELYSAPTQKIADILIAAVETERRVGQDNTTVIVARVEDTATVPESAAIPLASRVTDSKRPLALKTSSRGGPAVQSTPGAFFVTAALVLMAVLAGAGWWIFSSPSPEDAKQSALASLTAAEKPAKAAPGQGTTSPRLAKARTSKRIVPQNLHMFDCQIRVGMRQDPTVLLPEYCRAYFADRQDIKYE